MIAERATTEPVSAWTIYDHPRDYPDQFVARRFEIGAARKPYGTTFGEPRPTDEVLLAPTLTAIRKMVRATQPGMICFQRNPDDDPRIVETWL